MNRAAKPGPGEDRPPEVRPLLLVVMVFGIASGILQFAVPLFSLAVYDLVLPTQSVESLVALFCVVATLLVAQAVIDLARGRVLARAGARMRIATGQAGLSATGVGPDLGAVQVAMSAPHATQVLDLAWLPAVVIALFLFHPAIGWLGLAGVLCLAGASWLVVAAGRTAALRNESAAAACNRLRVCVAADRDYLATTRTEPVARALAHADAVAATAALAQADRALAAAAWMRTLRAILQLCAFALAARLALAGAISGGAIVAASLLFARILGPMELAPTLWPALVRLCRPVPAPAPATARGVDAPCHASFDPHGPPLLRLDQVTFRAGSGPVLVAGASLALASGQAVAILGPSGAGKSTLARLVVGALQPGAGSVLLAGLPPADAGLRLGYLPQVPAFLPGTVGGNLTGGLVDAGGAEAALRAVGLDQRIARLPQGLSTDMALAEACLSPAELRQLALARTIAARPDLLVLDDPDPGADAASQARLAEILRQTRVRGGGAIILTRQAAATAGCDRIVIMQGGRLLGQAQVAAAVRPATVAAARAP